MRRAVITGLGIVSSIGNNQEEVLESLAYRQIGYYPFRIFLLKWACVVRYGAKLS